MDSNRILTFERLLRKYQDSFEALHDDKEPCNDTYLVRDYLRSVQDLFDFISSL